MSGIELNSPAFTDHTPIPARHAKDDENVSPPLKWSRVPADAVELALLCEDPDAPSGTFVHWLMTGIDPRKDGLGAGERPQGALEHKNGYGEEGWGGPHPPEGDDAHRYLFRLYALPAPVSLPQQPSADDVHGVLDRQQVATATLVGLYRR
ncbi:YbhB/YbcL family Raf kinase inhibitor-like protein [Streptomyces monticola]|uniref:YbhB/YbcL family Raf kinase inhibitor-like protein n=1 Tax=Streptomyces monticola TaxID=2666263 RepID=A0ABW2JTT9_9ACTN